MKARFVFEAINFERGLDPLTSLGLGDPKLRDQAKLKKFADDNGFFYGLSKNGTPYVSFPVDYEENLGYEYGVGYKYAWIKSMEYTITYPKGWEDETPISLRKRWLNDSGKSVKQALIDRFPNIEEAMARIKKQAAIEMTKSGTAQKDYRR